MNKNASFHETSAGAINISDFALAFLFLMTAFIMFFSLPGGASASLAPSSPEGGGYETKVWRVGGLSVAGEHAMIIAKRGRGRGGDSDRGFSHSGRGFDDHGFDDRRGRGRGRGSDDFGFDDHRGRGRGSDDFGFDDHGRHGFGSHGLDDFGIDDH